MKDIHKKLEQIADDQKVHLLFACETGSRAWGFPSPDSDYDVRFIYRHDSPWYLSLSKHKDSIELMDGDLDVTGWDLKKCLLLLKRSNTPLIERFQSPLIYKEMPGFKEDFKKLIAAYYNPIAVFFHHYSLASKFWEEMKEQPDCKLKALFYLLRSLLSCNWILHDDSILPMHIEGLMRYSTNDFNSLSRELIDLKATKAESYRHPLHEFLKTWIGHTFKKLEDAKTSLKVNTTSMDILNDYFLTTLYANNHRNR